MHGERHEGGADQRDRIVRQQRRLTAEAVGEPAGREAAEHSAHSENAHRDGPNKKAGGNYYCPAYLRYKKLEFEGPPFLEKLSLGLGDH